MTWIGRICCILSSFMTSSADYGIKIHHLCMIWPVLFALILSLYIWWQMTLYLLGCGGGRVGVVKDRQHKRQIQDVFISFISLFTVTLSLYIHQYHLIIMFLIIQKHFGNQGIQTRTILGVLSILTEHLHINSVCNPPWYTMAVYASYLGGTSM